MNRSRLLTGLALTIGLVAGIAGVGWLSFFADYTSGNCLSCTRNAPAYVWAYVAFLGLVPIVAAISLVAGGLARFSAPQRIAVFLIPLAHIGLVLAIQLLLPSAFFGYFF